MKYETFLALDLELNQPSNKIIQVGVAIGGQLQSAEEFVVRQWLIDPLEPISPQIVALTGITDQDIATKAVPWAQVASELGALITEHRPFVNPVLWGAADSIELKASFQARGIEFPFMGRRWLDTKTWHQLIALAKDKNPAGGLRSVMNQYGLRFVGAPHRADADALNTLLLFFHILSRQRTFEGIVALAKAS